MRMRRRSAAVLALALALCAPPARTDEPVPPPALGAEEAGRLAAEVRPVVEEIRGLRFRSEVPVQVVDDRVAREHFGQRIDKFLPEAELRALQEAYVLLGILPRGTDLLEVVFDLLEEQAGGYYDPDRDTFFLLGDMPRSIAPVLIAHELTHALDDQHFGIDDLAGTAGGTGDRAAALGCVVEGSGTVVMLSFLQREMAAGRLSLEVLVEMQQHEAGRALKLGAAPPVLLRMLLAPYLLGQTFLLRGNLAGLLSGAKPADITRALENPPASTEQVLHPEKYWDPEKEDLPRPLELADLSASLGSGWSLAGEGDLGELLLALLTGDGKVDIGSPAAALPDAWTNAAAAGWGADRWQLYARGPQRAVLLATLWDTEADAAEFAAAIRRPPETRIGTRRDAVALVAGEAPRAAALLEAALTKLAAPEVNDGAEKPATPATPPP